MLLGFFSLNISIYGWSVIVINLKYAKNIVASGVRGFPAWGKLATNLAKLKEDKGDRQVGRKGFYHSQLAQVQ